MRLSILTADEVGAFAGIEQPRTSKMAWLQEWKRLLLKRRIRESWAFSCAFGSPHRKQFRFLFTGVDMAPACRPCTRDHTHVPVQGKFAKASATYVPAHDDAIGHCFALAISAKLRALAETDVDVAGLEDIVSSDLAQTLTWSCQAEWTWPRQVHINILESSAIYRMLKLVASRHSGPIRVSTCVIQTLPFVRRTREGPRLMDFALC